MINDTVLSFRLPGSFQHLNSPNPNAVAPIINQYQPIISYHPHFLQLNSWYFTVKVIPKWYLSEGAFHSRRWAARHRFPSGGPAATATAAPAGGTMGLGMRLWLGWPQKSGWWFGT